MRTRIAFWLLRKEVDNIPVIYSTLIVKRKKHIWQVPMIIRAEVHQILIDLEVPELANETEEEA